MNEHHRYIELHNGDLLLIEDEDTFDIESIAHSTSLVCRFGGQCTEFYSVAQHSIVVAKIMEHFGGNPLEGLLHDASEAYMLDMPTPIKRMLPDYMKLEKDLCARIRTSFGFTPDKTEECERADKLALFMEAYNLIPSKGATFADILGVRTSALRHRPAFAVWLSPMDSRTAKNWFLHTYKELTTDGSD